MAVDNQKTNKEIIIKAGDVILAQGHEYQSLNILHSGTVEILSTERPLEGLSEQDLVKASLKIYQLTGEYSFSEYSLIHDIASLQTVRALTDAKVSIYPFTRDQMLALPKSNPSMSLYIIRSIMRKINLLIEKVTALNRSYQDLLIFRDNLFIFTFDLLEKSPGQIPQSVFGDLLKNITSTGILFTQSKGKLPPNMDFSFLTADHGQQIERDYESELIDVKSVIDHDLLTFFYNFMKIDTPLLSTSFQNLPGLFKFPVEGLSLAMNGLIQTIYEVHNTISNRLSEIWGEGKSILALWNILNKAITSKSPLGNKEFIDQLTDKLKTLVTLEESILPYPRPNMLAKSSTFFSQLAQSQVGNQTAAGRAEMAAPTTDEYKAYRGKIGLVKNSVDQILKYSGVPAEEVESFRKILQNYRSLPDKLDASPEARRSRFQLGRAYWNIYYNCFIKSQAGSATLDDIPVPVQLMFKFGFLDETLVNENIILAILAFNDDKYSGNLDIHSTYDWVNKIYTEEKIPSITEMGLTFDKYMLEEAKTRTYAEMQEIQGNPETLRAFKANFEINQMITSCSRVCSESLSTAFPVLVKENVPADIGKQFLYKQQIDEVVTDVRKIDFTVYWREVIVKTKFRVEIVEKEVLPDFILLPTVGSKVMMWQDLESTNKRTKARFAIPQVFIGDLRRMLILALARFRWELCRTQKGPQWADPIEGGITGYYFDYISFYKKNPNLTEEAKEKIAEHIKSFRNNRERFAQDYLTYIEYETKGIPKLNKVLRDIFFRVLPLTKPVREKLKQLPAFEELEQKLTNIMRRKLRDLEVKFRKYEKDADGMPAELRDYLDNLNQ
jgi:CRP-like cAMP-binding protein